MSHFDPSLMKHDSEGSNFEESLNVLQSIYPELRIKGHLISLHVPLKPDVPVHFKLISPEQIVINEFKSKHFEPIVFETNLPISSGNVSLFSSWIDPKPLKQILEDIEDIIVKYPEDDTNLVIYEVLDFIINNALEKYETQIFSGYEILLDDQKQFNKLYQMCAKLRLESFNKARFKCSICLEFKDGKQDGILLDCDHAFCKLCLKSYALAIINDDPTKLQCPNCPIVSIENLVQKPPAEFKKQLFTRKISLEVLSEVIDQESLKKYDSLWTTMSFGKYQLHYPYSCSQCPRCMKWLFRDDNDDALVRCDQCAFNYCFHCFHSWHGINNPCGSVVGEVPLQALQTMVDETTSESEKVRLEVKYGRLFLRRAVEMYKSDLLFEQTVEASDDCVKCPGCSNYITKFDGCNKVQCVFCRTNLCYLCGIKLSNQNPYTHFSEPFSECYQKLFEGVYDHVQ